MRAVALEQGLSDPVQSLDFLTQRVEPFRRSLLRGGEERLHKNDLFKDGHAVGAVADLG